MRGTIYDKYVKIHNDLRRDHLQISKADFFKVTATLSTWHYPKKRWKGQTLTKEQAMIYEWMLNNNYNPNTVYKWLLAMNTNKENQDKLKKGVVSLKQAMKCNKPFKHVTEVEAEFMYHIKQCIQRYILR